MDTNTEKIQQAKQAIGEFLDLLGIEVDIDFIKNLAEPEVNEDEVLGKVFEFKAEKATFRVTEDHLRVYSFNNRNISTKVKECSEKAAAEKALDIVSKLVPRFKERNFVLSKNHDNESFNFRWDEAPKGKVISVASSVIEIELNRKTLELTDFYMFEFDHPRTEPPKISKEEAVKIAMREWGNKGKLDSAGLWEQVCGGKIVRTVWVITLGFQNDEFYKPIAIIIDADIGEILKGKKY